MTNKRDRQIQTLEQIYRKWSEFLNPKLKPASTFQEFYEKMVQPALKGDDLIRALFDQEKFPSLHDKLPIAGNVKRENLPKEWNIKSLPKYVSTDLERLLIAYIWKRGELWRVQHVLAGLNDDNSPCKSEDEGEDGPAVMWQFGKHLASPGTEPIFDQHTSRHRIIFDWLQKRNNLEELPDANRLAKLTTRNQCKSYLKWWNDTVIPRVDLVNGLECRESALSWADRIMFALGKAGSYKADKTDSDGGSETSNALRSRGVVGSKRDVAIQIIRKHAKESSNQVIKRLIKDAKLTEMGAKTYYYSLRGREL